MRAMRCLPPSSTDRGPSDHVGRRLPNDVRRAGRTALHGRRGCRLSATVLMKPAASLQGVWPPLFRRNSSTPPQSENSPCRSNGKAKPATLLAEILARHGAHRQVAEPRPGHDGEPVTSHIAELNIPDMLVAEPLL